MTKEFPNRGKTVYVFWGEKRGKIDSFEKGVLLGVFKGPLDTEYIVVDYYPLSFMDAWQYRVLLDEPLHLSVVPMSMVRKIKDAHEERNFSYGKEKLTERLEIHARSNIDFEATWEKIRERNDCKAEKPPKDESEYQIVIKEIRGFEAVAVTVYANGALQIKCSPGQKQKIVEWIEGAVELLPEHKHLVLFETTIRHMIWHTNKEYAYPSNEVIEALGKLEGGFRWYYFPVGWTYSALQEEIYNPFQIYLPQFWPLEKFLVPNKTKKKCRTKRRNKSKKNTKHLYH